MLDPKETKKGGFGAFADRERERREAEALKDAASSGPATARPTPPASDSTTRSDASRGTPSTT